MALSTQIFVREFVGVTATATPPATTAPMTNPIMILENVDSGLMRVTLSCDSENFFNGNSTFAG
ncbi:MAG: hypothetical protein EB011_02835 [Actinobacteria bacterium]|nr:hypothetical protein [Actinomycetota bacterium]